MTELIPSVSYLTWLLDRSLLDLEVLAWSFDSDSSDTADDLDCDSSSSSSSPSPLPVFIDPLVVPGSSVVLARIFFYCLSSNLRSFRLFLFSNLIMVSLKSSSFELRASISSPPLPSRGSSPSSEPSSTQRYLGLVLILLVSFLIGPKPS